jgi:hypothetical protein
MKIIIKFILVLSMVSVNPNTAHAIVFVDSSRVVSDSIQWVTANAAQAASLAQEKISAVSEYKLITKEFILDKIMVRIATNMINTVQKDMIKWINSGFKGKPLFIQNPEVFYQNIYKAEVAKITKSLLTEVGGLRDINRNVTREFIRLSTDEANRFTKSVTPTYGVGICYNLDVKVKDIGSRLNSINSSVGVLTESGAAEERDRLTILYKNAQSEYSSNCRGTVKTRNEAQLECLKDFACSGFEGMLSVIMDMGRNTESGRVSAVADELSKRSELKTESIKNELLQGNGFLSQRTCVEDEVLTPEQVANGLTPKCLKEKVTTPGQAAVSSLDQVIKDPVQRAQLADEINEAVANIASTFANKIIKDGLAYVTDGVNDVANSLDTEIANLERTIDGKPPIRYTPPAVIDLDTLINIPKDIGGATTTPTTSIPGAESFKDPDFEIENASDKSEIIKPLLARTRSALAKNVKEITYINKEITKYSETLSAYNQVAACYNNKYQAQQSLILNGGYTAATLGTYLIVWPDVIPLEYRKRAPELDSIIKGLEQRIANNTITVNNINKMLLEVDKANNYKAIEYYSDKIDQSIEDYLFVDVEWEQRDVKNTANKDAVQYLGGEYGLYSRLDEERDKLILPGTDDSGTVEGRGSSGNTNQSALQICESRAITPPRLGESNGF